MDTSNNPPGHGDADSLLQRCHKRLATYIKENGLKYSKQRETIADVFFRHAHNQHLTVEDLHQAVECVEPRSSQATIYRTLKILTGSGLAQPRRFIDGQTRYELADADEAHHDHLMCVKCSKIVEFVDDDIEKLQIKVAEAHGFTVTSHKMELYGICTQCRAK
jgi:Fur family transcriptional regulator, ferric uptake regulator